MYFGLKQPFANWPQHVDIDGKDINALPDYDVSYFKDFHEIIQEEIVEEKDLAMMGILNAIGIGKGAPYNPDKKMKAVFDDAAKEALKYLIELNHNIANKPYYQDRTWTTITPSGCLETGYSWVFPTYISLENLGEYFQPIFSIVKNFGAATFYLRNAKDKNGKWQLALFLRSPKNRADIFARGVWLLDYQFCLWWYSFLIFFSLL